MKRMAESGRCADREGFLIRNNKVIGCSIYRFFLSPLGDGVISAVKRMVRRSEIGRAVYGLGGWLILLSLVYAPWETGCVEPWAIRGLEWITISAAGICGLGCVIQGRWPEINPFCGLSVSFLLIQGWWMVLNAHGVYVWEVDKFFGVNSYVPAAPERWMGQFAAR